MFHFPTFPPAALCVQAVATAVSCRRVSPFGYPRITAWLAAPRGLSQPPTSFFGSWCQGIHHVPLLTWSQRCSRPLCSSQGTGGLRLVSPRVRTWRTVRRGPNPMPPATCPLGHRNQGRKRPLPQDPTTCLGDSLASLTFHSAYAVVLATRPTSNRRLVSVHW